jgi:starvation-inducible DNA-binding protein
VIHSKLEELYDAVAEEIDEVAERILMIGHRPSASMAEYLKKAQLKEAESKAVTGEAAIEQILADYQTLIANLRAGVEAAQEIGDEASADLMIGSLAAYEKTVWMLEAYLK